MIYEYRKLKIKIIAKSKEEAIEKVIKAQNSSITAMSFEKDVVENKIESQTTNIISWWCLCWYLSHIENKNGLLNHEKGKLVGLLRKLCDTNVKGRNCEKVKKKILQKLWIDGYEYATKYDAVIGQFYSKFKDEQIKNEKELYTKVAQEFSKGLDKLIDLVSKDSSVSTIEKYVDATFPFLEY